ncbi:hypothetical protein MRX96_035886 [Rhipicephalus microplus]
MRLELLDSGNSGFVRCSSFGEVHVTQERYFVLNQLAFSEILLQAVDHDSPECSVQLIQSLPHCCGSLPDIVHVNLGPGIFVGQEKWKQLLQEPKDSLFVRETAKTMWGIKELYNHSITGAPCLRFINKEGDPALPERKVLCPVKLLALRSAFDLPVDTHQSVATKVEHQRCVNRHLAGILKVLKQ